jgi:hypothetical protein
LKNKPEEVEWLLIAKAPPEALNRFFYFENVTEQDSLFTETMKVVWRDENMDVKELRR